MFNGIQTCEVASQSGAFLHSLAMFAGRYSRTRILLLGILLVVGCSGRNPQPSTVMYIANEGFMISFGKTKVLIDALPNSQYYANPSSATSEDIIAGVPPFDEVEYMLVTHEHADHFNAPSMTRFIRNHPTTIFVTSPEAMRTIAPDSLAGRRCSSVELAMGQHRSLRGQNAEVVALRLEHGGLRDIDNLAFIVSSEGHTIVHVGDAKLSDNEAYLRAFDWSSHTVDVLFLEFFDQSDETKSIIEQLIKPKYVVLMHISPGDEDTVQQERGDIHPRTVVFRKQNEMRTFDGAANEGSFQ
jgi:L-ascorbate metabolism protein UlaG (beta-lactamase superfamily)